LELHYTYGGGSKSTVYFNTYTIEGNKGKGAVYISKNAESPNYIWTYVYFGYDNDKMKAYGALIRPGKTDEILFDPI
jgi:protein transport protein SEC24